MSRRGAKRITALGCAIALAGGLAAAPAAPADGSTAPALLVRVGPDATGPPLPTGYLGISTEFGAIHQYTGPDAAHLDPVLVRLMRNLTPGQAPLLRIGGNSTDSTWWPVPGNLPPPGVSFALSRGWLATTRSLARTLGARLIVGLNLAVGRAAVTAAEARALVRGLGRATIAAFELGNEPDVYPLLPWYRTGSGRPVFARPPGYDLGAFTNEFAALRPAAGDMPVAGPAFAHLSWLPELPGFLTAVPRLTYVTFHRYPLRACGAQPADPAYPTIAHLLAEHSSGELASALAPSTVVAHAAGVQFRLDELNSVACSGRKGVSDTFASALWILDTLFAMEAAGVDGVNVHTLPGASYEPFTITHGPTGWRATVHPIYYGMLMFGRADPPGAVQLPVSGAGGAVKVWATRTADGTVRVVLINKDTASDHLAVLDLPGTPTPASVETLSAQAAASTGPVTLAGQTFGSETDSGTLTGERTAGRLNPVGGSYALDLPPASAAMITR